MPRRPEEGDGEERTRDRDSEAGARRQRALEEPLEYSVVESSPLVVLRVRNPLHGTRYLLYLPAFPARDWGLCTCPDFARRGLGTCKHLEGAASWTAGHPTLEPRPRQPVADPSAIWAAIDRRGAQRPDAPITGQRLRAIGSELLG